MLIRKAKGNDLEIIFSLAKKYNLESNDMDANQFLVAEIDGKIIGFGRLLQHKDCIELGTIGVIEEYRNKGIGKKIVLELLKKAIEMGYKSIYLTTLIPEYFKKFGFKVVKENMNECIIRDEKWCEGCPKIGCTFMKLEILPQQ